MVDVTRQETFTTINNHKYSKVLATPDIVKRVKLKFTSMAYRNLHSTRGQKTRQRILVMTFLRHKNKHNSIL